MLQVYDCVVHQHDARLEILAVLIALFGSHIAIRLLQHVATRPNASRAQWLVGAAAAAGTTMWATHFVAMLGLRTAVVMTYDLGLTLASLLAAILVTSGGFGLACKRHGWPYRTAGGALVGCGIAMMHYIGMAAVELPGFLSWDADLVIASVIVGCLFGAASMLVALNSVALNQIGGWTAAGATILLAAAMYGTHFTGVAAAAVHLTGRSMPDGDRITPGLMAFNIALVCLATLVLSLAMLLLDRRDTRLRAAETVNLHMLADIAVEGLAVCDGDRVVAVNRSLEQMIGRAGRDLLGTRLESLFNPPPTSAGMAILLEKAGERVLMSATGEAIPVEIMRKPILYDGRPHEVVAFRDLRERRRAEEEIRFLAHHDPLTALCNRTAFAIGLDRQLAEYARDQTPFALLGVDLDRFKTVNDTLGHPLGDKLLRRVADRLRAAVRDRDLIARIGGDEFSILLAGPVTADQAAGLAQRVVEMIRRPFIIDGEIVGIGASVGVALAPQDGCTSVALMKAADLALYRGKSEGGSKIAFFEPGVDTLVQQRRIVERDLRRALHQDELEVYYQPLFDMHTQEVHGFEALVRWRHPQRGLLLPADFVAVAEETGLIVPLGARVLTLAITQAAAWGGDVNIAVNLSAVQFDNGRLVDTVRAALAAAGLDPRRLELEITESVLLRESEATLTTLHDLRDLGVRISMDDFGTGYSSLRYLRSFPFDKIKIDRSFVHEMLSNEECATIIDAVIGIGRRLGITTTAEGVETDEQLQHLREAGCDMAQGYLIGRPEPAADAVRHLKTTKRELHIDVRARQDHV